MPDRVSTRIAAAFALVGLVAVLAVGAGMFVSLRSLHHDATISSLQDLAQPVLARVRTVGAVAELRAAAATLKPDLPADVGLYALVGRRVVAAQTGAVEADVGSIDLAAVGLGESQGGELRGADGSRLLYAATVVRAAGTVIDKIAIVLTAPDRSGALALRDLFRVFPVVVVVIVVVVAPIAWLLARSITRPLQRLAEATAMVPTGVPTGAGAGAGAGTGAGAGAGTGAGTEGARAGARTVARPLIEPEGPREVRELTGRFNAMTAELDRIRGEERDLLANIRHDLRTPLTVVAGFAEALRDGTATGDGVARAGDAIAQEASRMSGLVDDLRSIDEVGVAGAAGLSLRPEPLDPAALVADAVSRFEQRAAAAGVELRATSDPGLSMAADRAAVERILGNLIDNALAVVPAGGNVLVEARAGVGGAGRAGTAGTAEAERTAATTPASIALRVSDDGPGFPPGSLDRAFDRFYRADPARTGPGTGLGLSIVRALARAHGGDAVAENLAPTGARVTVSLPQVPAPPIGSEG